VVKNVIWKGIYISILLLVTARCTFDGDTSKEGDESARDIQNNELSYSISENERTVNELTQGCFAIQSPGTGKYLKTGSLLDGGISRFKNISVHDADHFYFKAADLGTFLLTNREGRYLSSLLPLTETTTRKPTMASEWKITAQESGPGSYRYKIKNRVTRAPIQLEYLKKVSHLGGWFHTLEPRIDKFLNLVVQNDCRPYPEMQVNVQGDPSLLKGDVNEPVRGVIDAHTHITSYEFMGGKVVHGDPFHRWGVPYALEDSRSSHGKDGSLDLIGNLYVFGDPLYRYDTRGWPEFPWWPNPRQLTHGGYYYKWMERAWLGGLRITVTELVENEVLCTAQKTINPKGWGGNSCNTMQSIRLQAKRLREMQDYIDAQYGGPGKGFFRIVTSPAQAREVIADGKLAVVMGVEVSEVLNCGARDTCSQDKVENGLMELYDLGVRSIFPAHKFDNQLSGAVVEDGFINVGEFLATGHYYESKECDEHTRGKGMTSGIPLVGEVPPLTDFLSNIDVVPEYEDHSNHCNVRSLTPLGQYLVNRMIDLNMIIELDHLSAEAATQVMDIVEARDYSGVVSSHSFMHKNKEGGLHNNVIRMLEAGGFIAPYNGDANGMKNAIEKNLDVVEGTPYLDGVGIGTDMSGLGGQAKPRSDVDSNPLNYPFESEFGLTFHKQVSGNRTFDLNRDGVAHYGMVADHIQDIRERSGSRVYEAVMNSAEAYLQMWERAEDNESYQHVSLSDLHPTEDPDYQEPLSEPDSDNSSGGSGSEPSADPEPDEPAAEEPVVDTPTQPASRTVSLLGAHNRYFVSEHNGGHTVNANRSSMGAWEKFIMETKGRAFCIKHKSTVSVRTTRSYYWSAQPDGRLDGNRTARGPWEEFQLINHSDSSGCLQNGDIISLRSISFNRYVVAENYGHANANRSNIGAWERIKVILH
jgi:microsomal dipeptidase-like Zn-dependent dipeptidase